MYGFTLLELILLSLLFYAFGWGVGFYFGKKK